MPHPPQGHRCAADRPVELDLSPGWQLDPEQQAAVSAVVAGPARVVLALGAPGTGKTRVGAECLRRFVANRVADAGSGAAVLLVPTRVQADRLGAELAPHTAGTRTQPLVRTAASLAFAILRRASARAGDPAPRLLTGADQDAILRELLEGHADHPGSPSWPAQMQMALGTAGFRAQLRELLMRAAEHGVDPPALRALGERHGRAHWVAASEVLREYEQVTALATPGTFDAATICRAAAGALEADPDLRSAVSNDLGMLVVDDAQELTASAAHLVRTVVHGGVRVLLTGDGDAAVHGFRGALPRRFVELAEELAMNRPGPARQVSRHVLRASHRQPESLRLASEEVVRRIGLSTGGHHRALHCAATSLDERDIEPVAGPDAPGFEAAVMPSGSQEAELVAHRLRSAHLVEGLDWSAMAVITRSGARQATMRRALQAAGVPVRGAPTHGPLAADPAVRPFVVAYEAVVRWCEHGVDRLEPEVVSELLTSPIGGADPVAMRRLRRSARRHFSPTVGPRAAPTSTDALLGRWVLEPGWSAPGLDPDLVPVARVARVLRAGREAMVDATGAPVPSRSAHRLLWAVWESSGVGARWERDVWGGGAAGARADRQLDVVMVLFAAVRDYTERLGRRDPAGFATHLAAQEVAADSLAPQRTASEEVAVLTPQAASGGQWDMVAVVGVQEGVWPDLRLRGSLLGSESLVDVLQHRPVEGAEGLRSARSQVWDDELRQFYVALTRARRRLLVTAVASVDEQPSVLMDLVAPSVDTRAAPVVPPRLTLRGAVADVRRDLVRAHRAGDLEARERSAERLRALSAAGVAWADPSTWLDARAVSDDTPRVPTGPVPVSPSTLQTYQECALRWLLTQHGGDAGPRLSSAVGTLVHDIVASHPRADRAELIARLEARWSEVAAGESWVAERQQRRAARMLERFVAYRDGAEAQGRELAAVEVPASVDVGRARLHGRVDRLERTADGSYLVVDLKTGSSKPTKDEIGHHPQLAAYQVAVVEGGLAPVTGFPARSAGAALAHLGSAGVQSGQPQRQPSVEAAEDPTWAHRALESAATGMAGAVFPATVGSWCRSCAVKTCCPLRPEGDRR